MALGLLTLDIKLPGCASLKEKRSRLKPLLARLHREFNISVAEIERQDSWQEATIACALVSNQGAQTQRALQVVGEWVEARWPDVQVVEQHLEII